MIGIRLAWHTGEETCGRRVTGIGFFDLGQEAYTLAALLLGIGALLDYGRKRTAG
jgi:hypothetical protein